MIVVCDFESTGIDVFEAEIITGFFAVLDDHLNVIETLLIQSNPFRWSEEAELVHGISKNQASKYKRFNKVYPKIINLLEKHKVKEFWCHSNVKLYGKIVPYDYALLRMNLFDCDHEAYWLLNSIKPFSTHSLGKVLQDSFTFSGFSLDNMCNTLGIELNHHDAESDCMATVQIIKQLLPLTTKEELYKYERGINENTSGTRKRSPRKSKQLDGIINQL